MLIFILLSASYSQAAINSQSATQLVPFFKSIDSLFPSGYDTAQNLLKQKKFEEPVIQNYYQWNNQLLSLTEIKPVFPIHLSESVVLTKTQERWNILELNLQTIKARHPKTAEIAQFDISDLQSDPYDMGFALTLKDVFLRQNENIQSAILTTIPQGLRLKPLEFKSSYFKVKYKTYIGYISLSEALTKFDFSTAIYSDSKWQWVKKREFDYMISIDNKKIHLSEIRGIVTPDTRGIMASNTQKIPLWSQVELIKTTNNIWAQSYIKGHGLIWWKKSSVQKLKLENEKLISIDQLLKKNISSISFHPKNPQKAILSAHGVYMTEDGLHWKKLHQFDEFNGPVHYFNDLLIFVGTFRSMDGGKKFDPYIQLDKLTTAIENKFGFYPKRLQIKKIITQAPFKLKLEIETGLKNIKMESPLFSQEWKATTL